MVREKSTLFSKQDVGEFVYVTSHNLNSGLNVS